MLSCGEGGSNGSQIVEAINENTEGVGILQGIVDGFYYETNTDILDIPITETEIVSLVVPAMPTGVYMIGFSVTFEYNNATNSVYLDMELNGVSERFVYEPSDVSNRIPVAYMFPLEQTNNTETTLKLSMSKEAALGTLNVDYANAWIEKKQELPVVP